MTWSRLAERDDNGTDCTIAYAYGVDTAASRQAWQVTVTGR